MVSHSLTISQVVFGALATQTVKQVHALGPLSHTGKGGHVWSGMKHTLNNTPPPHPPQPAPGRSSLCPAPWGDVTGQVLRQTESPAGEGLTSQG